MGSFTTYRIVQTVPEIQKKLRAIEDSDEASMSLDLEGRGPVTFRFDHLLLQVNYDHQREMETTAKDTSCDPAKQPMRKVAFLYGWLGNPRKWIQIRYEPGTDRRKADIPD